MTYCVGSLPATDGYHFLISGHEQLVSVVHVVDLHADPRVFRFARVKAEYERLAGAKVRLSVAAVVHFVPLHPFRGAVRTEHLMNRAGEAKKPPY